MYKIFYILFICFFLYRDVYSQEGINYDEDKVGNYVLPELLISSEGNNITKARHWKERQKEIRHLFEQHVYGRIPSKKIKVRYELLKQDDDALSGKAVSKQVRIHFIGMEQSPYMDVLLYLPKGLKKSPLFIGLNFLGNHSVHADTSIIISEKYPEFLQKSESKRSMSLRGDQANRWEIDTLIAHGYGVATAYYGDLEPDYAMGWESGVRGVLSQELDIEPQEWGAIGVWSWGLHRIMDYLETDAAVNHKQVIITGHSRLGKAALWAAANDGRFAAVVSNNSGEGGAALSRRWFGETIARINKSFPHWFIEQYKSYGDNVQALPVDQHMLLALVAPRPLYVASATKDRWADPKGEFLSAQAVEPIYNLFKKTGLGDHTMPPPDTSIGETVRYHIRTGEHHILLFDWQHYIRMADELVKRK